MGVRLSDVSMRKKIEMTKAIEKVIKNRAYITNPSRQVETQKTQNTFIISRHFVLIFTLFSSGLGDVQN